jgi:putative aldouronate transport system substrate-binding protein
MKKRLALVLAILLVFALFAGCNTKEETGGTSTPAPATNNTGEETPAPETEEPSPYNFAAGNYDVDARGFPTAPYEYELPLSTTDEVLSFWTTTWSPALIPEDGMGAMPMCVEQNELTGVNIDYIVNSSETMREQYAVLAAADDLCDITIGGTYYSSETIDKNIEDGMFVNLYEYIEYMPNYIYQATFDPADDAVYDVVFYKKDVIASFYAIEDVAFIGSNYMARGDWLEDLGLSNEEIVTWEDVRNMLTLFKTNYCEFPFPMFSTIDMAGNYAFTSYDTLPFINVAAVGPAYQIDGQVVFSHINDTDKEFMTMLNQWYTEGLIDPSWTSYGANTAFTDKTTTGQVGYVYMSPGEVDGYENSTTNDEDCAWVPIRKPLKTRVRWSMSAEKNPGCFTAARLSVPKCANIPLAVTWIDWRYSPTGSFVVSYGPEGVLWEKDENGDPIATEWAQSNPESTAFAWLCMLFGLNALPSPALK